MNDVAIKLRRKTRCIAEVRFEYLGSALDGAGARFEVIKNSVNKACFPESGIGDHGTVQFTDANSPPSWEYVTTPNRAVVVAEDPGTIQEFVDIARNELGQLNAAYAGKLSKATRIGFRVTTLFAMNRFSSYEAMVQAAAKGLAVAPLAASMRVKDVQLQLRHEKGMYRVGTIEAPSLLVSEMFKHPLREKQSFGLLIDVDSCGLGIGLSDRDQVSQALVALCDCGLAIERLLLQRVGALDES